MIKHEKNSVIDYVWHILAGDLPYDYDIDFLSKFVLLSLMILIGNFFIATIGIIAFIQGDPLLAGTDAVMFTLLTGLYVYLQRTHDLQRVSSLCIFLVACFYLLLFASGAANHSAFLWSYTFPLLTLFIIGLKKGTFVNIIFISITCLLILFSHHTEYIATYPKSLLMRFLASYIVVYIFAVAWESVRQIVQARERRSKSQLQKVIAELEVTRKRLQELSIKDGLTGLYNRRHFDEAIELNYKRGTRSQEQIAIFILDLDYFKLYNDFYGHIAGDDALKQFSRILRKVVRRTTDFIFRYGGEEFIILLSNTNRTASIKMAEEILNKLQTAQIEHLKSPYKHLTVSIGIFLFVPEVLKDNSQITDTISRYIEYADKALYRAKTQGRNRYVLQ